MADQPRHPTDGTFQPKPDAFGQRQLRNQPASMLLTTSNVQQVFSEVQSDALADVLAAVAEPGVHRPGGGAGNE
jgi:hypothetical protein